MKVLLVCLFMIGMISSANAVTNAQCQQVRSYVSQYGRNAVLQYAISAGYSKRAIYNVAKQCKV